MAEQKKGSRSVRLPSGHTVNCIPVPQKCGTAYIIEINDGDRNVRRFCSCNGAMKNCPDDLSPVCDCTTKPPTLSCE